MEAAYNAFFDRYHYLPGDMPDAVAVQPGAAEHTGRQYGGDGDGRLSLLLPEEQKVNLHQSRRARYERQK